MTAEEAHNISKGTSEGILEDILESVEKKAKEGEFQIRIHKHGYGDIGYYGDGLTKSQKDVVSMLRNLGYKAEMVVEENQFVNIYLMIEWGVA